MIWHREKRREKTGRRFTLLFAGLNLTTQPASSQLRAKRRRFVPHRMIPCEPPSLARPRALPPAALLRQQGSRLALTVGRVRDSSFFYGGKST